MVKPLKHFYDFQGSMDYNVKTTNLEELSICTDSVY